MTNTTRSPYDPKAPEAKLHQAMSRMHASDDLYDNVMAQVSGVGRRRVRHGRALPMAAVVAIAAAGALTLGGTAYAVANGAFFQTAMGDHGMGAESAWESHSSDGSVAARFTRQYQSIDPDSVPDDLANAVEPVGYTIESNGYTLTIDDMVADENGCGIVRFTLKNPNGIKLLDQGTPNELVIDGGADPDYEGERLQCHISADTSDGNFLDTRCFYDSDTATDTELHGTMYFTPIVSETQNVANGITWSMDNVSDPSGASDPRTDLFVPSKLVGVRTFSDSGDVNVQLSPFSVRYRTSTSTITTVDGQTYPAEFVADKLALRQADGTERIILKSGEHEMDNIINTYVSAGLPNGESLQLFTQLIDTSTVESVSLGGRLSDNSGEQNLALELTPTK